MHHRPGGEPWPTTTAGVEHGEQFAEFLSIPHHRDVARLYFGREGGLTQGIRASHARRQVTATSQPDSAVTVAMEAPMPMARLAPVTGATRLRGEIARGVQELVVVGVKNVHVPGGVAIRRYGVRDRHTGRRGHAGLSIPSWLPPTAPGTDGRPDHEHADDDRRGDGESVSHKSPFRARFV